MKHGRGQRRTNYDQGAPPISGAPRSVLSMCPAAVPLTLAHTTDQRQYEHHNDSMLSRHTTMGLLLLRATSTLAWVPAQRSGGFAAAFYRRCPSKASQPASAIGRSSPSRSSSSSSSSSVSLRTLATTTPTSAGAGVGEDRDKQRSSEDDGSNEQQPRKVTTAAVVGGQERQQDSGVEIQPLLQRHMEKLVSPDRRKVKTRQHVNPLAATFQAPVVLPERWFQAAFRDPTAPLLVDIGCAKGSFVRAMATEHPERNYLGLEIRRPTAALALERAAGLGTRNCHVVCCNANVDLDAVLTEAAQHGASIDTVCIQFPDPHFKTRHYKRRVLQPELVTCIEQHLEPGGTLFMQSDVLEVVEDMRVITRETARVLEDTRPDMEDWMEGPDKNPFGVQTEREKVTYEKESAEENRVYRCVFVKKAA